MSASSSLSEVSQMTAFQQAFEDYLKGLPEKKRKRKFIIDCQRNTISPDAIHEAISKAEQQSSKKIIRKVLGPTVLVMNDLEDIIKALVVGLTPISIIWGALKLVLDGASRFLGLFETIKDEVRSLTSQLQRVTEYEWLYGDSPQMQELLVKSYISMLRFWSRVDKECDRCIFSSLIRAASSFSTEKLRKIVDDLKTNANDIESFAGIIEGRKAKDERSINERERLEESLHRSAAQKERIANAAWREQQQIDHQADRYYQVCNWLRPGKIHEMNQSRHRRQVDQRSDGTFDWLPSDSTYLSWLGDSTQSSIIWLRAHPGGGKSTLCSHAIKLIETSDLKAATAYYFFSFDNVHTALDILRVLAVQLFEAYWKCSRVVSEDIYFTSQRDSGSRENIQDLIRLLVKNLPKTYFMLDGLDEASEGTRWEEAQALLGFLIVLSMESPRSARLWISSQDRPCIYQKLSEFLFDIKDHVTSDVAYYLSRAIPELDALEVSEKDKAAILSVLAKRAEGNFLWASLMVKALTEEMHSLNKMKAFIQHGLPLDLDSYYRTIFQRIEKPQRSLASKLYALITFARRPLRLSEIREAIWMLESSKPEYPDAADLPFPSFLRKLFSPLIIEQASPGHDDDHTCRFFHSTIRDFLIRNPDILSDGLRDPARHITPHAIVDACLLYLSQARYRNLLPTVDPLCVDVSGESVERHQFLVYCAKYWDKHLDDISETTALRTRVQNFLTSPNFLTCIQAQSLWVGKQFLIFYWADQDDENPYLRRIFPAWFAREKLWKDFRAFLHEWRYFLQCGSCDQPRCRVLLCAGQVDRCFWQALGSQNFMSKFQGRYINFTFQSEDATVGQCYDGVSVSGDELRLLRLKSRNQGKLTFLCEFWRLTENAAPALWKSQTISTDETSTNWHHYVKNDDENVIIRAGQADPVSFSLDCLALRIGSEIFAEDQNGKYVSLLNTNTAGECYPRYIEDFTRRGRFVAVVNRPTLANDNHDIRDRQVVETVKEDTSKETPAVLAKTDSDCEDDTGQESCSTSSTDRSERGYETWSDGTPDEDSLSEDDLVNQWASPNGFPPNSSSSGGEDDQGFGGSESSESEPELPLSAVIGYGTYLADTDSEDGWRPALASFDPDEDDKPAGSLSNRKQKPSKTTVIVFDTADPAPKRLFEFSRTFPTILFGSPPVIHPTESLMVWPLTRGEVLIVDFLARTYFVRKLRPSTPHTRHIFMKCHFSSCGRYLHIASLEGQRKPMTRRGKKKKEQPPLKLALLVSTYRLSQSKTTRCPPSVIHVSRVDLGSVNVLLKSNLPFALTWTPKELYFTFSDVILRVWRICLFATRPTSETGVVDAPVLSPQESIFLPGTAKTRRVHYFPPGDGKELALVIIGSEAKVRRRSEPSKTADVAGAVYGDSFFGLHADSFLFATDDVFGLHGMLSPPVGCYLKASDLGDWKKSSDTSNIPEHLGIGKLARRLEQFNPDEDCDLEPYII